jgi:hypothetical protein
MKFETLAIHAGRNPIPIASGDDTRLSDFYIHAGWRRQAAPGL